MKLENQICTLDQARKLKALGITQQSHFYYTGFEDIYCMVDKPEFCQGEGHSGQGKATISLLKNGACASAFTVAELMAMLPKNFATWRFRAPLSGNDMYICTLIVSNEELGSEKNFTTNPRVDEYCNTQAEALAAMLIKYLRAGDYLAQDCNTRLLEA